ncbi:MAG: hypothetical protein JW763_03825 [candidate division Zixibacteria bacterium]|nr:hypothetical protein [candidate division Zixibacteria bacterium]
MKPSYRYITFALSLVLFILFVITFWEYSIDDAFITFRYAEHFADGHGMVFNIGDKPVEGYSNFLWLLLLALLYKFGLSTYLCAKILGVVFSALAGGIWFWNYHNDKSAWVWLAGPAYLVSPITAFWAVSGLELGLYAFALAGGMVACLRRSYWSVPGLAILVLNRPEGFIVGFVLIATTAIVDHLNKKNDIRYLLINGLALVMATAFIMLFRLIEFGYIFPNTFYTKMGGVEYGFGPMGRTLLYYLPLTLLFAAGGIIALRDRLRDKTLTVAVTLFIVQAIVSSLVDPIMNFHFRYMAAFLPLLILVAALVVSKYDTRGLRVVLAVGMVTLFAPYAAIDAKIETEVTVMSAQRSLIAWIDSLPSDAVISITDVGRIPYYTDKRYHDIYGLVSEDIGQNGFNPMTEYLRFPDYFVLVGNFDDQGHVTLRFGRERLISKCRGFNTTYRYAGISTPPGADTHETGYYYIRLKKNQQAVDSLLINHPPRQIRN